jgi:hypothetical protein
MQRCTSDPIFSDNAPQYIEIVNRKELESERADLAKKKLGPSRTGTFPPSFPLFFLKSFPVLSPPISRQKKRVGKMFPIQF